MSTTSEAVQAALLPSAEKKVDLGIRRLPGVRAYDAAVRWHPAVVTLLCQLGRAG